MKLDYSSVINTAHYHNIEFRIISNKLREVKNGKQQNFLDVGFGRGKYLDLAARYDYRAFGIEVNKEYIKSASDKGYTCYHLSELANIDTKFDVILISHVIEHLHPDELVNVLESYIAMLSDEGIIILASPLRGERFYYDVTHIRPYYPQSIWHSFGGNVEEISMGRNRSTLILRDIHFIRDCYRTRNFRAYYIKDGLGLAHRFLRIVNYTMAALYIASGSAIGVRASWIGVYSKKVK